MTTGRARRKGVARSRLLMTAAALLLAPGASWPGESGRVFGRQPLLPAWLAPLDAEITVSADTIESHGLAFSGVDVPFTLERGVVVVMDARMNLGAGALTFAFRHDPEGGTRVSGSGRKIYLGRIEGLGEFIRDIPVDVDFNFEGTGRSPREIARSADGHLTLRNAAGGAIRKFGVESESILFKLLAAFNPFREKNAETRVDCLAIELPVKAGVVETEDGFEMVTQRIDVVAGGRIDLGAESVDLLFSSRAQQGVNLSSLASGDVVAVKGTLRNPEVKIVSGHVLEKAFSLGTHVATLGSVASNTTLCVGSEGPDPGPP